MDAAATLALRTAALDAAVRYCQPGTVAEGVIRMARVFELYLGAPSEAVDNPAISVPPNTPRAAGA